MQESSCVFLGNSSRGASFRVRGRPRERRVGGAQTALLCRYLRCLRASDWARRYLPRRHLPIDFTQTLEWVKGAETPSTRDILWAAYHSPQWPKIIEIRQH